jgi:hypothetical protein
MDVYADRVLDLVLATVKPLPRRQPQTAAEA